MRVVIGLLLSVGSFGVARGAEPAQKAPADFKLTIGLYGVRKDPINITEVLVRKGRAFRVISESSEVVVYDPNLGLMELLDLERRVHADVPLKKLDQGQESLRRSIGQAIAKREKGGGRGDRIAAEMSRNLLDPQFKETFDASNGRLRLTNPSVEIEMTGEAETDRARLEMLADAIAAYTKLGSLREPTTIPPFTRLDALRTMTAGHELRPTEMTVIYRLAGPPKKYRWTYRLSTGLTTREVETLAKISELLERSKRIRFDQYERPDPK